MRRNLLQLLNNWQMLGAHLFALAAGNAVASLAKLLGLLGVIVEVHRPALLLLCEGLEVLHKAEIVLHLRKIAHAGKHHHHTGQAGGKPHGPRGGRGIGRVLLKELLHILWHPCQCTALDRLHNDDRFVVFHRCLIASLGLYPLAVPVQIVDLQLYKLHLRVLGQNLIQQRGVLPLGRGLPFRIKIFMNNPSLVWYKAILSPERE